MKVWKLIPDAEPEQVEIRDALEGARQIIGASLDFTKVRYLGKLCTMAVDDEGMCKSLPVNEVATKAYLANCYEGTVWSIHGPAVVFDGVLR